MKYLLLLIIGFSQHGLGKPIDCRKLPAELNFNTVRSQPGEQNIKFHMTINGYLYAHCEETFEKYWINLFDVDYDLGRAQYSVDDEQLFDIRITSLEFTHAQKWKLFLNGQIDKNNDAYWHTWELEFNKDYSGASLIHRIVIPAYRSAAHRTQHIRTDIIEVIITK